ncbi:hypothetical protein LCGC14_1182770 [marine sediment metagenome]|uniref:Uncharacterized protein n=1 Tax=marine sediment metagenome TaxID=412755 RepID=A0A0F9LLQ6_9ZZZZ
MKPTCKLCETRHWTYEEHVLVGDGSAPAYVKRMVQGVMSKVMPNDDARGIPHPDVLLGAGGRDFAMEPVTQKTCNACNKPLHNRGKVYNACRQKAYRERRA